MWRICPNVLYLLNALYVNDAVKLMRGGRRLAKFDLRDGAAIDGRSRMCVFVHRDPYVHDNATTQHGVRNTSEPAIPVYSVIREGEGKRLRTL